MVGGSKLQFTSVAALTSNVNHFMAPGSGLHSHGFPLETYSSYAPLFGGGMVSWCLLPRAGWKWVMVARKRILDPQSLQRPGPSSCRSTAGLEGFHAQQGSAELLGSR